MSKYKGLMYSENQLIEILNRLRVMPSETEIVEFKRAENSFSDSDLGQYFSALSNEANLKGAECGWLVFGVDNRTHELTNSQYKNSRPALDEMKKKVSGMQLTVEIFANRMVFTNPGCSLNDVQRLIDLPPRSRNEELAGALLLFDICERRGSGYDRAVAAIEKMKLPPYKTESGVDFTRVTLYPWKDVSEMNKAERVQACYQHVCLMYEDGISVNNGSIRERFGLDKNKSAMASHIISDTLDANLIKVENPESDSRRYATYLPFYA